MNIKNYSKKITILALILFINAGISLAQTAKLPAPRQETLLNDLNFLIWNTPNAEKVSVKVRIHKGAAFDQQGKEGTMALLANILFPNQASREFFEEDLGGSLEITTNYDYIQINATADSDKILEVLQTLATAVINPQIDKENTEIVRKMQLEKVRQLEREPIYVADQAAAKRLYGTFPYGRPEMGTSESLQKIDFADLILAKNKFLTSDNATVAVIGNVRPDLVYRAARRYFGGWVKSDGKIPATFRLPEAPDAQILQIDSEANVIEMRYALEAVSRNHQSFFPGKVLERILLTRFQEASKQQGLKSANVRLTANLIKGTLMFSKQIDPNNLPSAVGTVTGENKKEPEKTESYITGLLKEPVSKAEFDRAKSEVTAEFSSSYAQPVGLSEIWLDLKTYNLNSVADELKKMEQTTLADVQKIAAQLQLNPLATVYLN